jgi:hypothetical protein
MIFFDESFSDKNVQTALLAARRIRRLLREAEDVRPAAKRAPTYVRTS